MGDHRCPRQQRRNERPDRPRDAGRGGLGCRRRHGPEGRRLRDPGGGRGARGRRADRERRLDLRSGRSGGARRLQRGEGRRRDAHPFARARARDSGDHRERGRPEPHRNGPHAGPDATRSGLPGAGDRAHAARKTRHGRGRRGRRRVLRVDRGGLRDRPDALDRRGDERARTSFATSPGRTSVLPRGRYPPFGNGVARVGALQLPRDRRRSSEETRGSGRSLGNPAGGAAANGTGPVERRADDAARRGDPPDPPQQRPVPHRGRRGAPSRGGRRRRCRGRAHALASRPPPPQPAAPRRQPPGESRGRARLARSLSGGVGRRAAAAPHFSARRGRPDRRGPARNADHPRADLGPRARSPRPFVRAHRRGGRQRLAGDVRRDARRAATARPRFGRASGGARAPAAHRRRGGDRAGHRSTGRAGRPRSPGRGRGRARHRRAHGRALDGPRAPRRGHRDRGCRWLLGVALQQRATRGRLPLQGGRLGPGLRRDGPAGGRRRTGLLRRTARPPLARVRAGDRDPRTRGRPGAKDLRPAIPGRRRRRDRRHRHAAGLRGRRLLGSRHASGRSRRRRRDRSACRGAAGRALPTKSLPS